MNKFSLIIPVYKQEITIRKNILHILDELSKLPVPFEIIAVIDGEVDKSMAEVLKIKDDRVKVVGYKTNHGKGYAVRFGIAKSSGDVVGFLDSGEDLITSALPLMLDQFEWQKADIVIGSKRHPNSKVDYPLSRKIMSWGYQNLTRILFGLHVRDTQVGMKVYRRNVLEDVMPRLLVKKFAFDIEMLAVANYLGYTRIYEAPIELNMKGNSSITSKSFWYVIFKMLWDTCAVFYRLKLKHYYDNGNKRKWKFDPELNFRINVG
jgi:glycosyltransferase involved in cell wall biosynthesis